MGQTREQAPEPIGQSVFVARGRALRGRFVAGFLMLNWGIMGWFTIRAPSLGFAALTLFLGLLAFVGALSQLRAARNAPSLPLVRWDDERFSFRTYTRALFVDIPWQRMRAVKKPAPARQARPHRDVVEVSVLDDRVVFFGWPEPAPSGSKREGVDDVAPRSILGLPLLEPADQKRVLAALEQHTRG